MLLFCTEESCDLCPYSIFPKVTSTVTVKLGNPKQRMHFFCVVVAKIPERHNLRGEIFTLAFQNSFRDSQSVMYLRLWQLKCELDAVHMIKDQETVEPETGAGHPSNTHHSELFPLGGLCLLNDPELFK